MTIDEHFLVAFRLRYSRATICGTTLEQVLFLGEEFRGLGKWKWAYSLPRLACWILP